MAGCSPRHGVIAFCTRVEPLRPALGFRGSFPESCRRIGHESEVIVGTEAHVVRFVVCMRSSGDVVLLTIHSVCQVKKNSINLAFGSLDIVVDCSPTRPLGAKQPHTTHPAHHPDISRHIIDFARIPIKALKR